MWSGKLFIVCFFALTILTTQSHVIRKRGLLTKLFGGNSKSTKDVQADMSPRERSKFRELLKNPVVIGMLSAAVGMIVQQALAAKNMNDVCDNKYVKMGYMAGSFNPQLQQALNLLGCNGPNRKYGSGGGGGGGTNAGDKYGGGGSTISPGGKYGVTTAPGSNGNEDNDDDEEASDKNDENEGGDDSLQSSITPEKKSKITQLLGIARGEKGAKRNFLKGLFGLKPKDKTFKKGHKLPSSTYKLDKDDADSMKNLEKEIEQSH